LWLDTFANVHLRPSTSIRHEKTIRVWLVPYFKDRELTSISRLDVHKFLAHCAQSPAKKTGRSLSPKTINEHLSCLSTMLNQAKEWGYLYKNPCEGVDRLELEPEEWDFYTAEEADRWLKTCLDLEPEWYPFFLTGFRTGLRLGEMFGLEWGDIDFAKRKIHVRRAVSGKQVTLPKSGKRRVVEMSPQLAQVLKGHKHLISPLVFCTGSGERLNRDRIKHPWNRITRGAGMRQLRHHDMRHSFASQLVMKGVPLLAVQQLLGHASLTMTMRYAHLAPGASQTFISLLDDVSANSFSSETWHNSGTPASAKKEKWR
jgi:integrase